jgi:putative SOS response-associated peptidase YedK
VDGFYEWKAIKGQRAKQPYAIAMKDGSPFGIAGIWGKLEGPGIRRVDQDVRGYHHRRK